MVKTTGWCRVRKSLAQAPSVCTTSHTQAIKHDRNHTEVHSKVLRISDSGVESLIVDRLVIRQQLPHVISYIRTFAYRNMNSHGQLKRKLAPTTEIALLLYVMCTSFFQV